MSCPRTSRAQRSAPLRIIALCTMAAISVAACAQPLAETPAAAAPSPSPATPTLTATTEVPANVAWITSYGSAVEPTGLTKRSVETAIRPLDLHGDTFVGIGQDGEIWLANLETGQETQITDDGTPKRDAAISEAYIAWTAVVDEATFQTPRGEAQYGLVQVWVQERAGGQRRRVTDQPAPRIHLAMDGDRLVWADKRNELDDTIYAYDIYGYDLATDEEHAITVAPGVQNAPAIHGDTVIWSDNRQSPDQGTPKEGCGNCADTRYDLYFYDWASASSKPLVADGRHNTAPAVYGDRVVWEVYTTFRADLWELNLESGETLPVTETDDPETAPLVMGDLLLWTVRVDCDVFTFGPDGQDLTPEVGVYLKDLASGDLYRLTDYREPHALLGQDVALSIEGCQTGFEVFAIPLP